MVISSIAPTMLLLMVLQIAYEPPGASRFKGVPIFSLITVSEEGGVDLHLAAEEIVPVEIAEDDVRIGNRRLFAASHVTGRAGIGAGAHGSDVDQLAGVEPCDTAPSGAHGSHIGLHYGEHSSASARLTRKAYLSVRRNAHVKARPAHIAGDYLPRFVPFQ